MTVSTRSKVNNKGESSGAMQKRNAPGNFEAASQRAQELRDRIGASPLGGDDLVLEAVEELRINLEELQVAEEELRKQNEELLAARSQVEEERLRYEELFESAPDGYLVTDKAGSILKANRAAAALLGIGCRLLIGKRLTSFVDRADRETFSYHLNRLMGTELSETHNLDLRISPRKPVVEAFDASLTVSPTRDREGKVTELRWLISDNTETKRNAERARELNIELEQRVRRRTAELEQVNELKDELLLREQRARAQAEAANRSKDEFLAIVSHELRTPLNAILGWAQLLRHATADEQQRLHAAEVIERSARIQARLINDILDVSRVVSGTLPLDKIPLNIVRVIEAAIEAARPGIESKGIELNVNLDNGAALIVGDPARLQQVIANMLSNSTKFTDRGGTIDVKLQQCDEKLRITVSDTGHGISPEFLPHVFDRFRQADSQVTRQQGGMGLGLSIVKILVELHGGTVTAASDGPEKGATFTVILPAAPESVTTPERQPWDLLGTDPPELQRRLDSVWVVVVDDDFDAREMMRAVLESAGARITTCGSYAEALALLDGRATAALSSRLPDVLVADIAMPDQDGFDLIRAIRRLHPLRGGAIPAIALTAYTDDETRKRALDEGYNLHLTKPLNLSELVSSIVRVRQQHPAPAVDSGTDQ